MEPDSTAFWLALAQIVRLGAALFARRPARAESAPRAD